jgi:dual specificity tyrosine-phosphorylation-regulated kinase 2/3/4
VSLSLIRRFASQLLHSLEFLANERIVHCDLKPENILLKSPTKSAVRLIDFGSSCFEHERLYTYIQVCESVFVCVCVCVRVCACVCVCVLFCT